VSVHRRSFQNEPLNSTIIADIHDARGRRLEKTLNAPARFTFTVDGRSDTAKLVREMQTDIVAWRWDEAGGGDWPVFRGVVAQGEDQLTEQSHTVTFTCHDYLGMVARRYLTSAVNYTQFDQDRIVVDLLARAVNLQAANGTIFYPASFLPLGIARVNSDGSDRPALSTQLRDRNYTAQSNVGQLIDDLAKCAPLVGTSSAPTSFDYDVLPSGNINGPNLDQWDNLRLFYPAQGVTNPLVLEYGSTVSTVTRSANSADYANYVRIVGNAPDATSPPYFSERWNADALSGIVGAVGLWQNSDNAPDVSIQSTLDQKAQGDLNTSGVLVPSYSLGLRPGTYHHGLFRMGDTVSLVIQSGRLNVFTDATGGGGVRVVGISYDIGDDGDENVVLTAGRPPTTLADLLRAGTADIDALSRR
jgi:hypothetical protein